MSKIQEIRILPPIAISRLGEAKEPLAAYTLEVSEERPLDFRNIAPKNTLSIDKDGTVQKQDPPEEIHFKDDDGKIRPVAPFLELHYLKEEGSQLLPLTVNALKEANYDLTKANIGDFISWDIHIANHKIFRRTNEKDDQIACDITDLKSHHPNKLEGDCPNFLKGKKLPFGEVQFIKPASDDEVIRLRFTPAHGKVYRSNGPITKTEADQFKLLDEVSQTEKKEINNWYEVLSKLSGDEKKSKKDLEHKIDKILSPLLTEKGISVLYDADKGDWYGYSDGNPAVPTTNPGYIYYGSGSNWNSLGYFDDACDGFVTANLLTVDQKEKISTRASIVAGPPDFAPDTMPVRVATDEIEQIVLGIEAKKPTVEEVEEIVRRSFETVRLMNTAVMNGNDVEGGKPNNASNMARQDTNDTSTLFRPLAATSIVDNLALLSLHERVFNGLGAGKSAWFAELLRTPEEIGDLTDEGRRKMPALMRGADARALTLTRRQIEIVRQAGWEFLKPSPALKSQQVGIKKEDLISQLLYEAEGNPYSVLPRSAVSNCFPGLEYDFRNLWRRAFEEIVLVESSNIVLEDQRAKDKRDHDLTNSYLVWIDDKATMVGARGPILPTSVRNLNTGQGNALFMEWSNNLAKFIIEAQKTEEAYTVAAYFTKEKWNTKDGNETASKSAVYIPESSNLEKLTREGKIIKVQLTVRKFFCKDSLVIEDGLIEPGEMTQGLCSPWQNDFIECACYYWAASRPDYVNVKANEDGVSQGDNWIAKEKRGKYPPSTNIGENPALLTYVDLFENWQEELDFVIKGRTDHSTDSST